MNGNKPREDGELPWKQFEVQVDLYKFFFDIVLKVDAFYYTLTGAILGFYVSKGQQLRYALLLPIALSVALLFFFRQGRRGIKRSEREVRDVQANLPLKMNLDISYLPRFITGHIVMFLCIAIMLTLLMVCPPLVNLIEKEANQTRYTSVKIVGLSCVQQAAPAATGSGPTRRLTPSTSRYRAVTWITLNSAQSSVSRFSSSAHTTRSLALGLLTPLLQAQEDPAKDHDSHSIRFAENVRIISAWKAHRRQRDSYERNRR
jgi:hypothetical protein